jgi:serine/threonine-protein kinase
MQQVPSPMMVSGAGAPLDACTQIASGSSFSCAICDHAPWCWGDDVGFQLGRGDTMVPGGYDEGADKVGVPAGTYTEVAAGLYAACAIEAGGALYCWGYGGHGELGDGSHASNLPTLIVPAAN